MSEPTSLDEALCLLQADPPVLVKDKKGQVGNQKTKYADLVQVNAVVLSRLNALGVVYKTKPTLRAEEPKFVLEYSLKHVASGTEETGHYPLKLSENPMQMGSAITYARRYVLLAITGIAAEDEDDDGQAAAGRGPAQRSQRQRGQRNSAPRQEGASTARRSDPPAARPPLPSEQAADGVTGPQLTKINAALGAIGWNDRDDKLRACSAIVGRALSSSKDLTAREAQMVIDALDECARQEDPAERLTELVAAKRADTAEHEAGAS